MAISRPLLLALIGLALLGATVFAVSNARNSGSDSAAPAAPTAQAANQAAPAPEPAAPAGPQQVLTSAFSTTELKSASFDGRLTVRTGGERNAIRVSGAFESAGPREMPKADVQVRLGLPGLDGPAGFVTTGDRAWLTRGSVGYAVPQEAWSKVVDARAKGTPPTADAPQLDVNPSSWLQNVKSEGTEQMDGVKVTHVSADVDSARAMTDVAKAMGTARALPKDAEAALAKQLDDGHIEAWVGEDKILRRVTLDMSGKGSGARRAGMSLDFTLAQVNEPQQIEAPSKVKKGLPSGAYGQLAAGFVGGISNSVGVTPDDLRLGVPVTNSHLKAERAVAAHRKVVIFFKNPRALDDQAVAESVRALDRRTKKVVVLTDDVRNADRYETLLEDLQVSQAPAIVVIGRSGKADLIEGYVDADSLVQVVADAR